MQRHGSYEYQGPIMFKRTTDHVDGNWPSFMFIAGNTARKAAEKCTNHFLEDSGKDLRTIIVERDFHISLSRPFFLRHHHIESFLGEMAMCLQNIVPFCAAISSEYYVLTNDQKSRSFLCMAVEDSFGEMNKIITAADTVLTKFKQPTYYANPVFHISIASMLPDVDLEKYVLITEESPRDDIFVAPSPTEKEHGMIKRARVETETTHRPTRPCHVPVIVGRSYEGPHRLFCKPSGVKTVLELEVDQKEMVSAAYDDDDDDDDEDDISEHILASEEDPLVTVLKIDVIECRVGNKRYRLQLHPIVLPSATSGASRSALALPAAGSARPGDGGGKKSALVRPSQENPLKSKRPTYEFVEIRE